MTADKTLILDTICQLKNFLPYNVKVYFHRPVNSRAAVVNLHGLLKIAIAWTSFKKM